MAAIIRAEIAWPGAIIADLRSGRLKPASQAELRRLASLAGAPSEAAIRRFAERASAPARATPRAWRPRRT